MLHSRSRKLRVCDRCAKHHCPQDGLTSRIRSVSSCGAVRDLASRNRVVVPNGRENMSAGEARDAHLTVQGATLPMLIYKANKCPGTGLSYLCARVFKQLLTRPCCACQDLAWKAWLKSPTNPNNQAALAAAQAAG